MKIAISFFFLLLPTWIEVYRDRVGDAHPNDDWKMRGFFCFIAAAFVATILPNSQHFIIDLLRYCFVATCFFSAIFPYWINYVQLKNGITHYTDQSGKVISFTFLYRKEIIKFITNHLSKKAWPDKTVWWNQLGWKNRLYINIAILIGGLIIFFL